jgi:hypothetical protein
MQKQQITTGTPVPPEWYNAMQNPTYGGTGEDVGHLPLPPDYSEKQQCKTIQVFGESTSVDLEDWPYNAVILVHKAMRGETPVYPRELIVRCTNTTGAIIVIPELDTDGTITVKATGTSIEDSYVTQTAVDGDIVVINANNLGSEVDIKTRKIRAGKDADYRRVFAQVFSIGTSENKISAQFNRNGDLVVAIEQGNNVGSIVYQIPLKSTSFSCGTENSNSEGFISFSEGNGNVSFKANSAGGQKSIGYSTENGVMTLSEKTVGGADYLKTYYGSGYIQNEKHLAGGKKEVILIGKNVDASFNIIDDNVGVITILHIPSDSEVSLYGLKPKKTCLTASGIAFFELQNGSWVNPSA